MAHGPRLRTALQQERKYYRITYKMNFVFANVDLKHRFLVECFQADYAGFGAILKLK